MTNYEKEFKIFSNNINQAARSFYYYREFNKQIYDDGVRHMNRPDGLFQDSKIYQAVQDNAQFWVDYEHYSKVFTVIVLGRIFDRDPKYGESHHIERLIKSAQDSGLFTNEKLRERKIKGSANAHEWIDSFMEGAYELSEADFSKISKHAEGIRKKWNSIKDLRNKIYAHQDVIDEDRKNEIFKQGKYLVFAEIINQLLTLENMFFQAFHNGEMPDFNFKVERIQNAAKKDVTSLLERLSNE